MIPALGVGCREVTLTRGDEVERGMGKLVDASTGAAELKAASISSSSSAAGEMVCEAGVGAGLRPCSKVSQNWVFWPPYWASY